MQRFDLNFQRFNCASPRYARRRGIAIIYTAMGLTVLLGIAAYTIDLGMLQVKQAQMQRAADAAALAGAHELAFRLKTTNSGDPATNAQQQARHYAGRTENGGYINNQRLGKTDSVNGDKVDIVYPAPNEDKVNQNNWFRVRISRVEPTLFASALGFGSYRISATATAMFETQAEFNIKGVGDYGVAPGPVNLAVFGSDGLYSNGDAYSTKKLSHNGADNPTYRPEGYNFLINIPQNMNNVAIEIFDPDTYNAKPSSGTHADAYVNKNNNNDPNNRVDEFRKPNGSAGDPYSNTDATTTRFSLYADNGTPYDYSDDTLIKTQDFGRTSSTDMEWNEFISGSRWYYSGQNFRMQVQAISGSSENGFDLRAGPKRSWNQAWNPSNGSSITAVGNIPMNFNQDGKVKVSLGTIPTEAAGGELIINKFDTDVGAKSIVYSSSSLPGKTFSGTLSGNGTFQEDRIKLPANYTAGTWYAEYTAGTQDTSVWDMSYTNSGPGSPGRIKLVR